MLTKDTRNGILLICKEKEGVIYGDRNNVCDSVACSNYSICPVRVGLTSFCYDIWVSIRTRGYSTVCIHNVFNRNI